MNAVTLGYKGVLHLGSISGYISHASTELRCHFENQAERKQKHKMSGSEGTGLRLFQSFQLLLNILGKSTKLRANSKHHYRVSNSAAAVSQEQVCMNHLPPFMGTEETRPLLPVGVQILLPSHTFTCAGRVTRWGVAVEGAGGHHVHFQIWRPASPGEKEREEGGIALPSEGGVALPSFSLVGSNIFDVTPMQGEKRIEFEPDETFRVRFKEGDILGLYIADNPDTEGDFQVPLHHHNVTGSLVMYMHTSQAKSELEVGQLTHTLLDTAPVIKVVIERGESQSR